MPPATDNGRGIVRGPQLLHLAAEAAIIATAGFSAFLLRFEFDVPPFYLPHLQVALAVWIVVKLTVFQWYRLDQRAWRYFSVDDVLQLARANAAGALISLPLLWWLAPPGFPRSTAILDLILCSLFIGARYLMGRMIFEARKPRNLSSGRDVLIYGADRPV